MPTWGHHDTSLHGLWFDHVTLATSCSTAYSVSDKGWCDRLKPRRCFNSTHNFARWYNPSQALAAKHVSYPQRTATHRPIWLYMECKIKTCLHAVTMTHLCKACGLIMWHWPLPLARKKSGTCLQCVWQRLMWTIETKTVFQLDP